jgi:glycosyltransferase involved in cell wall biosynthesis
MRICFFGDGESFHVGNWCRHFQSLGHEVHLITFKNVQIEHIQVHVVSAGTIRVQGGNWQVLKQYGKVKRILKSIKPDIFHALYATSYGITGALCGFKPYVITALGSDLLISPQSSKIYRAGLKWAFKRASWITVMSPQMYEVALEIGADKNKVTVVPFGINPKIFHENDRNLPADEFIVTSTRNLEKVYNIPHILKALAKIQDRIPNWHLNVIGYGTLENELKALAEELGITNRITFLGKTSAQQIANTFSKTHVFLSMSLSDGNNISLNEAMACGVFSIATDIPANRQWIKDGENGFLVPIDGVDELAEKLIYTYQHYDTLQDKALPINREIIQERGIWQNNMEKVEQKYRELVSRKV